MYRAVEFVDGVDVDDRGELLDELSISLLRVADPILGTSAVGDVVDHAQPERTSVRVDELGVLVDPDLAAVLRDDPVFDVEVLAGLVRPSIVLVDSREVVRMQTASPSPGTRNSSGVKPRTVQTCGLT